jgi:dihydroneopterin aldolase
MDRILISGLPLLCRIGVPDIERRQEQTIWVDADLYLDLRPAGAEDDIAQTVNYEGVCDALQDVARRQSYRLIEALAEKMASAVLDGFPVKKVRIFIKKPGALAARNASFAAVEIVREKNG